MFKKKKNIQDKITTKLIHIHITVQNILALPPSGRSCQHPLGLFNYLLKVTSLGSRKRLFKQELGNIADTKITHILIFLQLNRNFWKLWSILLTLTKMAENSSMIENITLLWSLFHPILTNGLRAQIVIRCNSQLLVLYFPKT